MALQCFKECQEGEDKTGNQSLVKLMNEAMINKR